MIFIIIYIGFAIPGSFFHIVNPTFIIGTIVVTGLPALMYSLIQLVVYILLFIWLIQRKERGRKLGIFVSIYHILLIAVNYFAKVYFPDELMAAYETALPGFSDYLSLDSLVLVSSITSLFTFLVGVAIILYLYFKKQYFRA